MTSSSGTSSSTAVGAPRSLTSLLLARSSLALAAVSVLASATAVLVIYHQRESLFGRRGYDNFERKYKEKLKASRLHITVPHGSPRAGGGPGLAAAGSRNGLADGADVNGTPLGGETSALARVKVIYGSDSGTAEGFARGLAMTLCDRGVPAALVDPSHWDYFQHYRRQRARGLPQPPLFADMKSVALQAGSPASKHSPSSAKCASPLTGAGTGAGGDGESEEDDVLLFVVATAGEGEPTGNFLTLFQEIQEAVAPSVGATPSVFAPGDSDDNVFRRVRYAVFALGDSSYKYYCRAGISVHTALAKGGGAELYRLGFADAGKGKQEESFEDWQDGVLQALRGVPGIVLGEGSLTPPRPRLTLTTFARPSDGQAPPPFPPPPALLEASAARPARLRLLQKTQLTPAREADGSAVYRLSFSLEGTNISYQGGDHLGVYPANPPEVVQRCAALLGLTDATLDSVIELQEPLTRTTLHNTLPARTTLRTALTYYTDLCGRPKRSTLRVLAKYCADEGQKLLFLDAVNGNVVTAAHAHSSPVMHVASATDCTKKEGDSPSSSAEPCPAPSPPLRTVLDYMETYRSCCPTAELEGSGISVGHFMEIMPRVQPRYYSIASDRLSHPQSIDILVRVLTDGLASRYFADQLEAVTVDTEAGAGASTQAGAPIPSAATHTGATFVYGFVRVSTFHLPPTLSPSSSFLLIGAGTGAAAMVGLLYRREALMRRQGSAEQCGQCTLFFGAQHEKTEFFIRDEVVRWSLEANDLYDWDTAHPSAREGAAARHAAQRVVLSGPVLSSLECAFSRDQKEKIYVTSLISAHGDQIYDMLVNQTDSYIFLSGDASSMAKDVDRALVALIQEKSKKGRLSALSVVQRLENQRRFLKDVY